MMLKPQGLYLDVSTTNENYGTQTKGKPTAVVPPISRATVNLGPRSEASHGLVNGSVPSSPESDCGESPASDFFLDENTRNILGEFFCHTHPNANARNQKVVQTMRRVVHDLRTKHQLAHKGMLTTLSAEEKDFNVHVISSIAKEMFNDGVTNWGRIASLLAFGELIFQHEEQNGRRDNAVRVKDEIAAYLLSDQRQWLVKNKAWDGFVEFFHVSDPESAVRTALMAFVTVAGIGAGIAFFTR